VAIDTSVLLRRHPFFVEASEAELNAIVQAMHPRRFAREQQLFARGDSGDGLYLIVDGLVRLSLMSSDGRELTVRLAGSGEVIGEIAAIDEGPRTTDGHAVVTTQTLLLPHDEFQRCIDEMPTLRRAVLRQICARLRATTDQLEGYVMKPLESRLARLFVALSRQLSATRNGETVSFPLTISQREIASLVGASRPRVNQLLVSWQESGIVTRRGAIVRCQIGSLEDIERAASR
jgi:CRP-like cAMP-binding protein